MNLRTNSETLTIRDYEQNKNMNNTTAGIKVGTIVRTILLLGDLPSRTRTGTMIRTSARTMLGTILPLGDLPS